MNDRGNGWWWVLLGVALLAMLGAGGILAMRRATEARQQAEELEAQQRAAEAERAERRAAAHAFGNPTPPMPEDVGRFTFLFDQLGDALRRQDAAAIDALFNLDLLASAASPPMPTDWLPQPGTELILNPVFRWDRTEIRRIRWTADRSAALVVAVHRTGDRTPPLRVRWWVTPSAGGWKVFDLQDVDGGIQLTRHLPVVRMSRPEDAATFRDLAADFRAATVAMELGDRGPAARLLGRKIPDEHLVRFSPQVHLLAGMLLVYAGNPQRGFDELGRAELDEPELPLTDVFRTVAVAYIGDYDAVLGCAQSVADRLGPDPLTDFWRGFVLEELGRPAEAAGEYRAALGEDPDRVAALDGLRRTVGWNAELMARIGRTQAPRATYEILKRAADADQTPSLESRWPDPDEPVGFDWLREQIRAYRVERLYEMKQGLRAHETIAPVDRTANQLAARYLRDKDAAGLAGLIAVHAQFFPNDPMLELWRGELHLLRSEFPEAAVRFHAVRRLDGIGPADQYAAGLQEVRCWVRADETAKAHAAVQGIGPQWVPAGLRAAVLATAGDVRGVERMLAARAKGPHGVRPLYADPDFARLMAGEKFAVLRQKYPDPLKQPDR
jgi:hypothetical protein